VTIGKSSDLRFTTSGVSIGGDMPITERLILGLGAGFGHERQDVGSNGSRMNGDSVALIAYGSFQPRDAFFIDALAGFSRLDLDGRRHVTETGEYARSKRQGDQWFLSLSGVYEHLAGEFLLAPYGRIELTSTHLERSEEQGAGDDNLVYFSQTAPSTRLAVGMRGETEIMVAAVVGRPYLRLEYQHELTDRGTARMAYADDFTTVYRLDMGSSDPHNLVLGAGSDFILNYGWILGADYRFTRGSASTEMHSFGASLRKQF
jgi:large repetitive protein